jgi:hypothetical protein
LSNIASLEAQVKTAAAQLQTKVTQWEIDTTMPTTTWSLLEPTQMTSKAAARLTTQGDRRILVTESKGPDTYEIDFRTGLRRITGIRLEALTDPSIASAGPGFPSNGNFVVNEFELFYKADAAAGEWRKVSFQSAVADFSQADFDIAQAIDGNSTDIQNGWAVSPRGGAIHWSVFRPQQPIELTSTGQLRVAIVNLYPNEHQLACFRVSATSDDGEIPLGLPEDFSAVVRTPAEHRTDALRKPIRDYFLAEDNQLRVLEMQLATARQPLPPHPEIVQLQMELEKAKRPLDEPAALTRLKRDAEHSTRQIENRRLTNAEDLAWALINSPSFLFNR